VNWCKSAYLSGSVKSIQATQNVLFEPEGVLIALTWLLSEENMRRVLCLVFTNKARPQHHQLCQNDSGLFLTFCVILRRMASTIGGMSGLKSLTGGNSLDRTPK
jgi:hypothetical protein